MRVTRLVVTGFRSYARAALETEARMIALIGPNGAGKTNLLEALSLLAPGRGLRGAPLAQMARVAGGQAAPSWGVAATLATPGGPVRIATGVESTAPGETERRTVRIDGETVPATRLAETVRLIWLTPAMDRLFAESAGGRRRFLDRMVLAFDPGHGTRVAAYEKAMRERNRLLAAPRPDPRWLEAVERQMAETGTAIAAARRALVDALAAEVGEGGAQGGFPWAALGLTGALEQEIAASPAADVEDRFAQTLAAGRREDQGAGRTLSGPHRSDLEVVHGPKGQPAHLCSTGEQKALLVGLILGHARLVARQSPPILLLDEIAAHLDEQRRAALFATLDALGLQVWMTGTGPELFVSLPGGAERWQVEAGTLARS
ncbi:DNA replication/repair protein RecF [Futiania mangrovi]|uniref:DNA replication and repair protein RecF n=1 Tax=Futiania mangrovi TaxID=2959716 RepID=A0A9J6PF53_9PROT|nr:DNA replication/repair protein RecF [Futiania mangrovii]MCP1336456.1 DNA replication/repair protein RecF [Futiania mangrovii]